MLAWANLLLINIMGFIFGIGLAWNPMLRFRLLESLQPGREITLIFFKIQIGIAFD